MGTIVELRAELLGLFAEVLDADEHTIDLPTASRVVGACSRLQSVLAARDAALSPALRRLELRAAQTRPAEPVDADDAGDGSNEQLALDDPPPTTPTPAPAPPAEPAPVVPRVSVREQRRRDLRAKWLDLFDGFAAALAAGRISTDHADALAAVGERLEPWVVAELHALEDHLLSYARTLGPEALTTELHHRIEAIRDDRGQTRYQQQLAESRAWLRLDRASGMYHLHASLDPIRGEALQSVLDQYLDRLRRDPAHERTPHDRLLAQAVHDLVVHDIPITPRTLVVVDEQSARTGRQHGATVCENVDGARVPLDHALTACAINGNVTAAIIDRAGRPADLTTRDRCADDAQRLELRALAHECVFPGCDTPYSRCHQHHVVFHEHGGATSVSNLVTLCHRHHHDIHDRGWHLTIDPQRTVTITRPDGSHHATVHATRLDGQPIAATPTATESPPGRLRRPAA